MFKKLFIYAISISCIALSQEAAIAGRCDSRPNSTEVSKSRLQSIGSSGVLRETTLELGFQRFSLDTRPLVSTPNNNRLFRSTQREAKTQNYASGPIKHVQPDGVGSYLFVTAGAAGNPPSTTTYEDSSFYEAKAVQRTYLPPSYSQHQVTGLIDALRNETSAGKANKVPPILFMTTSDVPNVSVSTRLIATASKVAVRHSVLCEDNTKKAQKIKNFLFMSPEIPQNPEVYILNFTIPLNGNGSGRYGSILQ